ncbi:ribonuclease T2-like protein [Mycena galericulata]|nr:ribonuclease T2-like protein [Mycena galericulata]
MAGPSMVESSAVDCLHEQFTNYCLSQDCGPIRRHPLAYKNIAGLLTEQGAQDTLTFINTYWKNDPNDGSDEEFWEHEWETHGTSYSTLQPTCLPSGSPTGAKAVAFYTTAIKLFQGITPSSDTTYTLDSLTSALQTGSGFTPVLDCQGSALDSVSWYFNLQGTLIDGTFVPINAPEQGTCPSSGIQYLTKSDDSTDSGSKTPKPKGTAYSARSELVDTETISEAPESRHLVSSQGRNYELVKSSVQIH